MAHILVVDDQPNMRATTALMLQHAGHVVEQAGGGQQALEAVKLRPVDVVITDLRMSPMSGLELVEKLKDVTPSTQVLVMTAYGSVESAVTAMRLGAVDYIPKPFTEEELLLKVERAMEHRWLLSEMKALSDELRERYDIANIVGRSSSLKELLARVIKVATTESNVLITGESGTGKELIARAIHTISRRSRRPFVPVNCAAINEQLLESELFGHAKGAFTGAVSARRGLFEEADGGTFFFDEIAETSVQFQAKLLRAIQEHEIRRVGENVPLRVDVRVLAATNVDLRQAIEERRFREDLYYRLNVVALRVPPLRERLSDVPLLVQHFLDRFNKRNGTRRTISAEAISKLTAYDFPGNVRELQNLVEQAAALAEADLLGPDDFVLAGQPGPHGSAGERVTVVDLAENGKPLSLAEIVARAEERAIRVAIDRNEGRLEAAARSLGISHTTLWRKMRRLGISKEA
jgi:two-component system, NtrC family, response regulator HydG